MNLAKVKNYLVDLEQREELFKQRSLGKVPSNTCVERERFSFLNYTQKFLLGLWDFLTLKLKLRFCRRWRRRQTLVYTARNFCLGDEKHLKDRILSPLNLESILYLNQSKHYYINRIDGQKVYNVGLVVKVLSKLFWRGLSPKMRIFKAYCAVNESVLRHIHENRVFTLCYYDLNGLSLAFSRHRKHFQLCELQHGSIINYPTYEEPSPIQVADVFYVKNEATVNYLKTHLNQNYDPDYQIIPYSKNSRKYVPGIHLFYASTVEFNGIHSVLLKYLEKNDNSDVHLIVRLHPRERDKQDLFEKQLSQFKVNYEFDSSMNWLESMEIENIIVLSPWSSTIEDAYDNGFTTIILDPVGKERYAHLLDDHQCYFSTDISETLEAILSKTVST